METGKTAKYFKYAIGEIILVVIGILIALQVNNWNEKRKQELSQNTYLERLIQDLNNDLFFFNRRDTLYKRNLTDIQKLVDTFFAKQDKKAFEYVMHNLTKNLTELLINKKTYDEMISTGTLYSFDNKKVLTEIQDYYNWSEINQFYINADNEDLVANWQKPFYSYVIIAQDFAKKNQPLKHLDFSSFYNQSHQNNIDFRAYLLSQQHLSTTKLSIVQDQIVVVKKLIETLKKELDK
jgi:hypothetical protein